MSRRSLALTLLFGTLVLWLATIPGLIEGWDVENEGQWGFKGMGAVAAMIFALAGALLALKRPENAVGWLFGGVGAAFAVITAGETYAVNSLLQGKDGGLIYQIAWLTSWAWVIFLGLIAFAVLLFPSGDLPSPRWRIPARLMAGAFLFGCFGFALTPGSLNNMPDRISNRYGLPPGPGADIFVNAGMLAFLAALVAAAVGVTQRYRSARGLEKQQMKLFALAAAGMAVSMVFVVVTVLLLPRLGDAAEVIASLAMMSIPIAMTFAILRYRLYDIDLIINRTLVYGALSAVLALIYLGSVVLLQPLLSPLTADSDIAIAASTLAVAALFRPARARVQNFIDQRFYRRKYDAQQTLAEFSARLRNQVDLDTLAEELVGAVGHTMEPLHARLWLRPSGEEPR